MWNPLNIFPTRAALRAVAPPTNPEVGLIHCKQQMIGRQKALLFVILGTMLHCSVPGCTNQGGHKFPFGNKARLKQWIFAIKWEDPKICGKLWQLTKNARVCQDHFDQRDYPSKNYYGLTPSMRDLLESPVPHVFECWKKESRKSCC
ncbi:uncharacterized protein LOC141904982 [Tubulanus polymorphus]|uniref:uncharacterized protein LOC141904982 n=1 Tax=Tubulanus polymorphus TaxID=672921 RepID=UPI003DA44AFD